MSELSFTPGPWNLSTVADGNGNAGGIAIDAIDPADGRNFEVCEVWGINLSSEHDDCSRANARLIAAAPDLLEALRILTAVAEKLPGTHGLAVGNARAAIAKATQS